MIQILFTARKCRINFLQLSNLMVYIFSPFFVCNQMWRTMMIWWNYTFEKNVLYQFLLCPEYAPVPTSYFYMNTKSHSYIYAWIRWPRHSYTNQVFVTLILIMWYLTIKCHSIGILIVIIYAYIWQKKTKQIEVFSQQYLWIGPLKMHRQSSNTISRETVIKLWKSYLSNKVSL